MKTEFFCCIGGELKDKIQGLLKSPRVFFYRAAESESIDDMLVDGFFNDADDIRTNDIILLYCPEQTRAYTWAKVSSIVGGLVKTKELSTNISIFINDAGYLTANDLAEVALTGAFDDLVDVTITSPTVGQYLRWNGSEWINMDGDGGGGGGVWGAITGDIADQSDLQLALSDKADVTALSGKADIDLGNIDSDGEDVIKALAPDGDYDNTVSGLSATTLQTAIDELAGDVQANGYHPDLFDCMWKDHEPNDMRWLRADTFSWQDGTVYSEAYQHLLDDIAGKPVLTEVVAGITIGYFLADDGHKIVGPNYETAVSNLYNTTGIAWYYVIDTVNQKFKLPRTKFGFTGIRGNVGNYVAPGLPNITGQAQVERCDNNDFVAGAFYLGGTTLSDRAHNASAQAALCFDASRSSGIYGASSTVQPPATQMILYFYVGNFTQSAIENTAGLNASLFNDKVDIASSWGMPSTVSSLPAVVSGGSFIAPKDGFIKARATASAAGQYLELVGGGMDSLIQSGGISIDLAVFIPVKKGATVSTYYSTSTPSFSFVYAQKTN